MDIALNAGDLRKQVKRQAKNDTLKLMAVEWNGQAKAEREAIEVVNFTRKRLLKMIDQAETPITGRLDLTEAEHAFSQAQLASVEAIVSGDTMVDNRFAQTQAMHSSLKASRAELKSLGKGPIEQIHEAIAEFVNKAKSAAKFLKELTSNPLKYAALAYEFANGTIARYIPGFTKHITPHIPSVDKFMKYLNSKNVKAADFFKANKYFAKAAKFLGVLAMGFQITTTVFEAVANSGKWANIVSKAVFAAGATIALDAIVSSVAVTAAITSTLSTTLTAAGSLFSAAAGTIEAPPVAVVLAAAGIVIIAGVALVAIFDSLIGLIFGSSNQDSMSISMSRGMIAGMDRSMSKSLSVSMYP